MEGLGEEGFDEAAKEERVCGVCSSVIEGLVWLVSGYTLGIHGGDRGLL